MNQVTIYFKLEISNLKYFSSSLTFAQKEKSYSQEFGNVY